MFDVQTILRTTTGLTVAGALAWSIGVAVFGGPSVTLSFFGGVALLLGELWMLALTVASMTQRIQSAGHAGLGPFLLQIRSVGTLAGIVYLALQFGIHGVAAAVVLVFSSLLIASLGMASTMLDAPVESL